MPSVFSHAVVAGSLGAALWRPRISRRCLVAGMICAALPDADYIGYRLGVAYGSLLGHRGLTHSLPFAVVVAAAAAFWCVGRSSPGARWWSVWSYLFVATASHGILDAMTTGGLGVAFFSPFSNARYVFPWTPILISPLGIRPFISERGLRVLASELKWLWIPSAVLVLVAAVVRRRIARVPSGRAPH